MRLFEQGSHVLCRYQCYLGYFEAVILTHGCQHPRPAHLVLDQVWRLTRFECCPLLSILFGVTFGGSL